MTPLAVEMLLHYHCCVDDFRNIHMPAQQDLVNAFLKEDFLRPAEASDNVFSAKYVITERGTVYVKAVLDVPFPEWVPGYWRVNSI